MMHDPQSQSFDPNRVLQQVWQSDYPNTWRVFSGSKTITSNVLSSAFPLIAVVVILGISICSYIFMNSDFTITKLLHAGLLLFVLVGVTAFFTIRRIVKEHRENKKLRQQPNPTLVVMPDGVVEYSRQTISSLAFADVAYMRLKVQANSTVPASPSIWLDLSFYDGRRDVWSIDIDPQDMIAQCILGAYNTYHVMEER